MRNTATMKHKTMGPTDNSGKHFEPDERLQEYLESLSGTELRELSSYVRRMAVARQNPERAPGIEGGRWLVAHYVRGSGPYFYVQSYKPGEYTYTDSSGRLRSGKQTTKYVGRRLPADLAEEFGYLEGATPEETDVHITGTPGTSTGRRSSKNQSSG